MVDKVKFGIFIELEEGLDGLLHKNDINSNISIDNLYIKNKNNL